MSEWRRGLRCGDGSPVERRWRDDDADNMREQNVRLRKECVFARFFSIFDDWVSCCDAFVEYGESWLFLSADSLELFSEVRIRAAYRWISHVVFVFIMIHC